MAVKTIQSHYLDHAATTPMRECAIEAWVETVRRLGASPGNPSALHSGGRTAKRLLSDARERVARALDADIHEVVFTSGATESDALAVSGAAKAARAKDSQRTRVLVSALEHDAVAHQREVLDPLGFQWDVLPVDSSGVTTIDAEDLRAHAETLAIASMTLVCSEVGTIQPVLSLVEALRATGAVVHTDAAQALITMEVSFAKLGVDFLSLGGHKVGGPVGVGTLLARRGIPVVTDRPGGGQERKIRSGTSDVAGAVALAAALEETVARRAATRAHLEELRTYLLANLPDGLRPTIPSDVPTSPSIIHLSLPTRHPEAVLMTMDGAGVLVSAGSACHAGVTRPSQIVMALGRTEAEALGVLRISVSHDTTHADIDAFLATLPRALEAGRALDSWEEREK